MLRRIRSAMGQRDAAHMLSGVVEFDDAYVGGPKAGGKRGRGTEKAKIFVALSLDEHGNPQYLKMGVTKNIKQASVKKFAHATVAKGSTIHSDGYRSYLPALEEYIHEHKTYVPNSGMLHWLHIVVSNASYEKKRELLLYIRRKYPTARQKAQPEAKALSGAAIPFEKYR